jgi:two-component system response regulator AtoC
MVRQTFGEVLEDSGYEVTLADGGLAALAVLGAARPDLVLLDIAMPGMNGLDALTRIAALHPRLPVIMITAYADVELAAEAIKRGAADYVHKPVDLDDLARAVSIQVDLVSVPGEPVLELTAADTELPSDLCLWPAPEPALAMSRRATS